MDKDARFAALVQKMLGEQEAEGFDPVTGQPIPKNIQEGNGLIPPQGKISDQLFSDMFSGKIPAPNSDEYWAEQGKAQENMFAQEKQPHTFATEVMSNEEISESMSTGEDDLDEEDEEGESMMMKKIMQMLGR